MTFCPMPRGMALAAAPPFSVYLAVQSHTLVAFNSAKPSSIFKSFQCRQGYSADGITGDVLPISCPGNRLPK
jgi:hypothetical protein